MCFSSPKVPEPTPILREPAPEVVAGSQDRERRLRLARGSVASTILTSPLGLVGSGGGATVSKLGQSGVAA